jgi:hypothetical protein
VHARQQSQVATRCEGECARCDEDRDGQLQTADADADGKAAAKRPQGSLDYASLVSWERRYWQYLDWTPELSRSRKESSIHTKCKTEWDLDTNEVGGGSDGRERRLDGEALGMVVCSPSQTSTTGKRVVLLGTYLDKQ